MLTDVQKNAARLHCGYPLLGNQTEMASLQWGEEAYYLFVNNQRLEFALDNLTPEAESLIANDMLSNLDILRTDIFGVRENSDTQQAAVWTRNSNELGERQALYTRFRRELCDYLNIEYGPAISAGSRRVRC